MGAPNCTLLQFWWTEGQWQRAPGENIFVVAAVADDDDFPVMQVPAPGRSFALVNNRTVPHFMPFHWKLEVLDQENGRRIFGYNSVNFYRM